jgi:hypothetical protein
MTHASTTDQGEAELARLYVLFARIFRGGFAGTLAGILFLGVGARIVMRISALLNQDAEGLLTDNENVVGEITPDGTLGLIIFVGILGGLLVGTVWVLVREWLPGAILPRAGIAGTLAILTGSFQVINSRNPDFALLDPPALHVAMFALLLGLTGITITFLDRVFEGRLPERGTIAAILGGLAGFGLIFAAPLLVFSFFSDQDRNAPAAAGLVLIVVTVATVISWIRYYATGETEFHERPVWLQRLGVTAVGLFGLVGGIHLVGEITAIV